MDMLKYQDNENIYGHIFDLEPKLGYTVSMLRTHAGSMDSSLANTFVALLFNFYDKGYELSQYSEECPYLQNILEDYKEFISAFSKIIKFCDCFDIPIHENVTEYFYAWKRRLPEIEKIKYSIDRKLADEDF